MVIRHLSISNRATFRHAAGRGDVADWILGDGRCIVQRARFLDELCWRLVRAGLPLWRATLHVGTLHPQLRGIAYRWWRDRSTMEEIVARHGIERTSAFLESPVRSVLEHGRPARYRFNQSRIRRLSPLLKELRADGVTDYLVLPLTFSNGRHNAVTFATKTPGGFAGTQVARLTRLLPALRAVLETFATREITANLLDAYIGRQAARRVLEGQIRRGTGESIDAIILVADMRNFTRLSDQLPGAAVIALLNEFFENLVRPIHAYGGEVLKFLGDGLIAIFSIATCGGEGHASECAVEVARSALASLDGVNARRARQGESPIAMGVALHSGKVFYGNVGASDRLDFTAVGPAVNLAARLETMTKVTGYSLLTSERFARIYPGRLIPVGSFELRGLSKPEKVFSIGGLASKWPAPAQPRPQRVLVSSKRRLARSRSKGRSRRVSGSHSLRAVPKKSPP